MTPDPSRFVAVFATLLVVVVVVVTLSSPPDPYTQLRGIGPGVVVALVLAYLVAVGSGE